MKKVMSYLCNLYNRCGGTRLFRLLALLLALAVTTPVLLGVGAVILWAMLLSAMSLIATAFSQFMGFVGG